MKKILCLVASFALIGTANADTIQLKSGKLIEGNIVERNEDRVKIDTGIGVSVSYYLDEIESISSKSDNFEEVTGSPKDSQPKIYEEWFDERREYLNEIMIIEETLKAIGLQRQRNLRSADSREQKQSVIEDASDQFSEALDKLGKLAPPNDLITYNEKLLKSLEYLKQANDMYLNSRDDEIMKMEKLSEKFAVEAQDEFRKVVSKYGANEYKASHEITKKIVGDMVSGRPGDIDKSIESLEQAIELNPHNEQALMSLGGIYAQKKRDYNKAIGYFKMALDINDRNVSAHMGLAMTYAEMGKRNEARDEFNTMLSLTDDPAVTNMVNQAVMTLDQQ